MLPPHSFKILTEGMTFVPSPELSDFQKRFEAKLERRVQLGEIAPSSRTLYESCAAVFFGRMAEIGVQKMDDVSSSTVEEYLVWRKESIVSKGRASGARGLVTECTVLASIFDLAMEEGVLRSSPLKTRYKPDVDPAGAEPFTPEELFRLEKAATGEYELPFLVFRWTGLRCSDVSELTWGEYDAHSATIKRRTTKRKTWVTIPLTEEVNRKLIEESRKTKPAPQDKILRGATKPKLARMVSELGRKAGVENATPHRFRDSLAVEILSNGGTIYDVARVLGITIHTAETHYTEFTPGLQDNVRKVLEKSGQERGVVVD